MSLLTGPGRLLHGEVADHAEGRVAETVHRYRDLPARLNVVLAVVRVPEGMTFEPLSANESCGLGPLLMTVKTIGVLRGTDAFDNLNLKSVMVTVTLTGVAMLFAAPTRLR